MYKTLSSVFKLDSWPNLLKWTYFWILHQAHSSRVNSASFSHVMSARKTSGHLSAWRAGAQENCWLLFADSGRGQCFELFALSAPSLVVPTPTPKLHLSVENFVILSLSPSVFNLHLHLLSTYDCLQTGSFFCFSSPQPEVFISPTSPLSLLQSLICERWKQIFSIRSEPLNVLLQGCCTAAALSAPSEILLSFSTPPLPSPCFTSFPAH